MIQKITQNNWNFWTVNLIMPAKKLLTSRQIFRYAVPARSLPSQKALVFDYGKSSNLYAESVLVFGNSFYVV